MSAMSDCRQQSTLMSCPNCGREGAVEWMETQMGQRDIVRIEGGFFERMNNEPPFGIDLVCPGCGATQPAPLQV